MEAMVRIFSATVVVLKTERRMIASGGAVARGGCMTVVPGHEIHPWDPVFAEAIHAVGGLS